MSVTEKTAPGQHDTLAFELDLQHSPSKVWRALTDPELLAKWLLPTLDHKLEQGAAFTLKAPPQPGWDGTVNCRYLEVEPERRLTWSWIVGDIDTLVTATLSPTPAGTRLLIVQSGFKPNQKQNFGGARYGWNMMTGKLVELLATLS